MKKWKLKIMEIKCFYCIAALYHYQIQVGVARRINHVEIEKSFKFGNEF
jgi:hypothetical protein